ERMNGGVVDAEHVRALAAASTDAGPITVLQIPYVYFPDEVGGTEIYVAGLVDAARRHGILGAVAAPGAEDAAYDHDGVPVFRFATGTEADLAFAYGEPDATAARSF